jgi:small subunit ribosomal protein S2
VRHVQIFGRTQLTGASLRCIQVIAGVLGRAGEAGQKQRLEAAAKGQITYRPAQGLTMNEIDADAEISRHMDEVRDGEDHRQKGGRSIKFSD